MVKRGSLLQYIHEMSQMSVDVNRWTNQERKKGSLVPLGNVTEDNQWNGTEELLAVRKTRQIIHVKTFKKRFKCVRLPKDVSMTTSEHTNLYPKRHKTSTDCSF